MTTFLLICVLVCVTTPNHERGRIVEWFVHLPFFWQDLIGSIVAIFTLLIAAVFIHKYLL